MNCVCIHNWGHSSLLDAKPGYVFIAGTIIHQNITWWEESPPFFKYMERCKSLLQEGNSQAFDFPGDIKPGPRLL